MVNERETDGIASVPDDDEWTSGQRGSSPLAIMWRAIREFGEILAPSLPPTKRMRKEGWDGRA